MHVRIFDHQLIDFSTSTITTFKHFRMPDHTQNTVGIQFLRAIDAPDLFLPSGLQN